MQDIFLCSICNVSSGGCKEDCKYCTQSIKHKTNIEIFKEKPIEKVLSEARAAKNTGALGFCLVTSGRSLTSKKTEYISKCASAIKKDGLELHLIACCGSSDKESLKELKKYGIDSYNHNLETSQEYFKNICTTHTWEERYLTCQYSIEVGLGLCAGGIMGIGESSEDRKSFYKSLKELNPHTSPINFFIPNDSLPIKQEIMQKQEAIKCIKLAKSYLPNARLMMAGGREVVFGQDQKEMFEAGINAIILGNYLTAEGENPSNDIYLIKSYGYSVASSCH